jgi:leucyl-tRNA synthetase
VLSVVQRGLFIPDWRERLPQVKANLTDEERQLRRKVHQTVKAVTEDIEGFRFNTAVAAMMELLNELQPFVERMGRGTGDEGRETERIVVSEAIDLFLRILHPFAPHITDELWERLGNEGSLFTQSWAEVDEEALVQETITIVVQVNGRVRGRIVVPIDADEATIKELALQEPNVRAHLEGKEIKRIIIVPRKIVNIVV